MTTKTRIVFQIKDMMAAAQKMIQERKAQLNTVAVCMHVVQGGLKSIH